MDEEKLKEVFAKAMKADKKGKIKKIKIKKNNDLSINGYIENEYGTRCALTASNRLTIEKLNEVIDVINKLIEWTKTQDIRCTPFCETINENINSINYLLHELQQKDNIIKEVREYIKERRKYKGEPFYLDEIQTEIVCEILDKVGDNNVKDKR